MHSFFGAMLPPVGDGAEDDLFPNRHGKLIDVLAGKSRALVTAVVSLRLYAVPDRTLVWILCSQADIAIVYLLSSLSPVRVILITCKS